MRAVYDSQYGPWAGKIPTCDETNGLIRAVDASGNVTGYNLGIGAPEDVLLIPSGQHLYVLDEGAGALLKVTKDNFTGFVGDILVVHEGLNCGSAGLFIVHWDGARFLVRQIAVGNQLEHAAFAPMDIGH